MSAARPHTSLNPLARMAGFLSLAAAAAIVGHQLISALGRPAPSELVEVARGPLHAVNYGLGLVGFLLLLLALTGLYVRHWEATGTLGLVGYLVAFVGTALTAGDWWFESFAVPWIAEVGPQTFDSRPTGRLVIGGAMTFFSFMIGWVLFAVAGWRARVFPRPAAALLIVGAVAGQLAGPLFQVPLALGVGWMGLWLWRSGDHDHDVVGDRPLTVSR